MAILPTISIAINVNFERLPCISVLLKLLGDKYGHYADEPHCYRCKLAMASGE